MNRGRLAVVIVVSARLAAVAAFLLMRRTNAVAGALVVVGLAVLGFDAADFTITGLSVIAALLIAVGLWLGGAFSRAAWIADDEMSARLDRVDQELTARAAEGQDQ